MSSANPQAPRCVGIILDGNRRYAKERGLATAEGHRLGYEKVKEVATWCKEVGIKYLIVYAFSTENWKRAPEEVSYLKDIFHTLIFSEAEELRKNNGAVRFIGDTTRFGEEFQKQVVRLHDTNPSTPDLTVVVALSYGGRAEIVRAAQALLDAKPTGPLTEDMFAERLWTQGIPDPDLIIRTGGARRLSNFLPWQSVYSELFFVDTYWPAFSKEEFLKILAEYSERERRFGK